MTILYSASNAYIIFYCIVGEFLIFQCSIRSSVSVIYYKELHQDKIFSPLLCNSQFSLVEIGHFSNVIARKDLFSLNVLTDMAVYFLNEYLMPQQIIFTLHYSISVYFTKVKRREIVCLKWLRTRNISLKFKWIF